VATVAKTEPSATDLATLLKELAGSAARCAQPEDRIRELMRLADQPLLLRDFMERSGDAPPRQMWVGVFSTSLHLDLAGTLKVSKPLPSRYATQDAVSLTSLRPEVFTPSSLDLGGVPMDFGLRVRRASMMSKLVGWVVLCGIFVVATALMT
jgi:hypothetical protein